MTFYFTNDGFSITIKDTREPIQPIPKKVIPIRKQSYFNHSIPIPENLRESLKEMEHGFWKIDFTDYKKTGEYLDKEYQRIIKIPNAKREIQQRLNDIRQAGWEVDEMSFDVAYAMVTVVFKCSKTLPLEQYIENTSA